MRPRDKRALDRSHPNSIAARIILGEVTPSELTARFNVIVPNLVGEPGFKLPTMTELPAGSRAMPLKSSLPALPAREAQRNGGG